MSDKISVIIPAYNAEKFIVECLDSVENQTYKNVEIIVVDDGSGDNTYNVVKEYAEKHDNIVLVHQENGGVCAARNKGLDLSTGEYVMFLDADDYLMSKAIELLYGYISVHGADIAAGTLVSSENSNREEENANPIVWQPREAIVKCLEDNPFTYSSCGKLFKRGLIGDMRFVNGRRIHEDSYFNFCVMLKDPRVVTVDQAVYIYRDNPNSASHAMFSEKFFDILYFADEKCKKIKEQRPELLEKSYNVIVKANLAMLHCFCRTKDKKYNKDIKKSVKAVRQYGKYFVPAISTDERFFKIVRLGLFKLYRRLYWKKYPLNK